jgi:two-component system cell cycle sensor histidine kinase/response regulator CckA
MSGDIAVRLRAEPDEPVSLGLAGVRGLGEAAVLLSLADTTEETRLKRQVAQATKMQAVGQLAGGVAHDFNNVLTAIIGICDLMLLRHTPGDSDYDDIQQIKANSNRAASLTRQLLAFSPPADAAPASAPAARRDLRGLQLLKRLLGAKITLKTTRPRPRPGARRSRPARAGDRQPRGQRRAMRSSRAASRRGTLSSHPPRRRARRAPHWQRDHPAGDYTALIAEDTGGGIPPATSARSSSRSSPPRSRQGHRPRPLDRLRHRQAVGRVHLRRQRHRSGQAVKGARFTIYLPVHQATEEELRQAAPRKSRASGRAAGAILLVEDEDMVRAVAERALARQGYTVVTARRRRRGRRAVRDNPDFDLVVSDVVMPSMDGPAMAREIRSLSRTCRCCSCRATPRSSCGARSTSRRCTSSQAVQRAADRGQGRRVLRASRR